MNIKRPVRSFAICHLPGAPNSVRRLAMEDNAQESVTRMIERQLEHYIGPDIQRIPFDPTYLTDEESALWIEGFQLPEHLQESVQAPREIPAFAAGEPVDRIKYVYHVDCDGNLFFQCWRNIFVLDRDKIWLFLDDATFVLEEEKKLPLVLSQKLDAACWGGDLLFKNYANVSSMLDMLDYVAEATAEDIEALANMDVFEGNSALLSEKCSKLQRRQIRQLVKGGTLRGQSAEDLEYKAMKVEFKLDLRNGKIYLPPGGRELSSLLQFLSDKRYIGIITGNTFVANSATLANRASQK